MVFSYQDNNQFVETGYDGSIPDEEFYEQMGYPNSSVTPVMKSSSEVEQDDFFSKPVFRAETVEDLIGRVEGPGALVFRYDGEDLEMGSKFQAVETEFEVTERSRDELEVLEDAVGEHSSGTYAWTTNTATYLSMEDLKDGLSNPVLVEPDIQGVSGIVYNPNSHVEIREFRPEMIEISEELLEEQAARYDGRSGNAYQRVLEKKLRKELQNHTKGETKIELYGREIPVKEDEWQIRDYPVDHEAINSITKQLESNKLETERILLGPSQQPHDQDFITTDFEKI